MKKSIHTELPEVSLLETLSGEMLKLLRSLHVNMPWRYMDQYLDVILQLGMNVEIGFEAVQLDAVHHAQLDSVATRLHDNGCRITLHGPFWDLNAGSVDRLIAHMSRYRLMQFFDIAEAFEPVQVVCHTGFDPRHHRSQQDFWMTESLKTWEPMVKRAERSGVPLLLENVWENGPDLHAELFRRLASPCFGFCLDVGHQNTFSNSPLPRWLDVLMDQIMEIHLHDNDGSLDQHLPVGKGNIDFVLLFERLKQKATLPVLTLEPHLEEHLTESLAGLLNIIDKDMDIFVV